MKSKDKIEICKKCDKYNHKTTQCKVCGCFMKLKIYLPGNTCKLGKHK